ncbi:MAG: AAA family ATPase [Candidatus Thorarchaeota archaeon]
MVVNQNFLICLAGLPASGKTTFAKKLKDVLERKFNKNLVKIIDPDIIRQSITKNTFNYRMESEVRKKNLSIIKKELEKGNIVISDDLNYYSSMRHDLKKIADFFNIHLFIFHISTPYEICIKWNKSRGKPIPDKIIKRIHKKFDNFDKYGWDYPEAKYDLSQVLDLNKEVEELVELIEKKVNSSEDLLKRKVKSYSSSNMDNQHLDVITRNYVGKLLQQPELHSFKKKIIKARKMYVKLHKNKSLQKLEIIKSFREFLEFNLDIKISEEL